jgi:hypothetical protein
MSRRHTHTVFTGRQISSGFKTRNAKLKKIMQQGFSDTANREHEPKVNRGIDTFIKMISEDKNPGTPLMDGVILRI